MTNCLHCGTEVFKGEFCRQSCAAAHDVILGLGLENFYQRRRLDPAKPPLRPDEDGVASDYSAHAKDQGEGLMALNLMVEGVQGGACMWLIESVLARQTGVISARLNLSDHRLSIKWRAGDADANSLVSLISALGYRLVPFDPDLLESEDKRREKELLRALAVAGFAAANVMLLSIAVWAGLDHDMGQATRSFLYWLSALIALPAIAYAGIPFYRSAYGELKQGRINMDAPIAMALIMAPAMSLYQVTTGGQHAYFDSAVALLFFLLVGRYFDCRARGRACSAAEHLLGLNAVCVTVIDASGKRIMKSPSDVSEGMKVLVAAGERLGVDGTVLSGDSLADVSLISGESLPASVRPGDKVFAGTVNLSNPLTVEVTAAGEHTLLAEIVIIMEAAEQAKTSFVALADRIAVYYGPVVHVAALLTFFGWMFIAGAAWHEAMVIAMSVVIITCPCALALAVPAVQVAASGRLFRGGELLKSATALERLAKIDVIAFDKTGTLTTGRLEMLEKEKKSDEDMAFAASLAGASRHPLSRALIRAAPGVAVANDVREEPGKGLSLETPGGEARLGCRQWCGVPNNETGDGLAELWLSRPGREPLRFAFEDRLRSDARDIVSRLKSRGFVLSIASGDRAAAVSAIADDLGIEDWRAGLSPKAKCERLQELRRGGHHVLMVGDGLNDAPALAAAYASLSPSTAMEVSQIAADAVFQGALLHPVSEILDVAKRSQRLIKQNLAFAFAYNAATLPLAVAGLATPLIAAIAMSASSLVVVANALRIGRS